MFGGIEKGSWAREGHAKGGMHHLGRDDARRCEGMFGVE